MTDEACAWSELTDYGFWKWLQPEILTLDEDSCVARLILREELCNGKGVFHGGVIYALGDALSGLTCRSHGARAVTQNADIRYFSNCSEGAMRAEVHRVHKGRSTAVYRVCFFRETDEKLIAEASYSFFYLSEKNDFQG